MQGPAPATDNVPVASLIPIQPGPDIPSESLSLCILLTQTKSWEDQGEGKERKGQRGETGRQRDRREVEGEREETEGKETHLGKQVVHVAYSAAIFIDGDEVPCPTTA